jgi:hypothetical protein
MKYTFTVLCSLTDTRKLVTVKADTLADAWDIVWELHSQDVVRWEGAEAINKD